MFNLKLHLRPNTIIGIEIGHESCHVIIIDNQNYQVAFLVFWLFRTWNRMCHLKWFNRFYDVLNWILQRFHFNRIIIHFCSSKWRTSPRTLSRDMNSDENSCRWTRNNRRRWTRKPNVQTALSRPCLVEQTDTEQKLGTADRNRTGFSGNSQQNETRTRYGEVCADVWVKARVISSLHVV